MEPAGSYQLFQVQIGSSMCSLLKAGSLKQLQHHLQELARNAGSWVPPQASRIGIRTLTGSLGDLVHMHVKV